MPKLKRNILLEGASGKFGDQVVYKQYRYGTVVSKIPDRSNVVPSEKQKGANSVFRKAVAYAKAIINDPDRYAEFIKKVPAGKTVYHTAIREYFQIDKLIRAGHTDTNK